MKLTSKMKSVAMQAKSVEELLKLAEEYGYEISKEEAEEIYDMVSEPDEDESYAGGCRVEDISVEEI